MNFEVWVEDELPKPITAEALESAWRVLLGAKVDTALALATGESVLVFDSPEIYIKRIA